MNKYILALTVSAALATTASADTLSYTNSYTAGLNFTTPLSLTQFDPALGTLDSMTISLASGFTSTFTITNIGISTYGDGSTAAKFVQIWLGTSAIDLLVNANNPNGSSNPWLNYTGDTLDISGLAAGDYMSGTRGGTALPVSSLYTDSTTLADFTGTGATLLDVYTITGFSMNLVNGSSYDSSSDSTATVTSVVTYDFAPVPEPSTLAMSILGGLGGSSLLLLRRRK